MDNSLWEQVVDSTPINLSYLEAKQKLERQNELRQKAALVSIAFVVCIAIGFHGQLLDLVQGAMPFSR